MPQADLVGDCEGQPYGIMDAGVVEVYLGGPDGLEAAPHWTLSGTRENESMTRIRRPGDLSRGVGDFDGDGYDDILVRVSRGYDTESFDTCGQDPDPFGPWDVPGQLYEVYRGGPDGLETTPTVSHQRYESTPGGLTLGPLYRLDFNGDGKQDLLHHVSDENPTKVMIQLWPSTSAGPTFDVNAPAVELIDTAPWGVGNIELNNVGDLTGDGREDLVIAASYTKIAGDETGTPGRSWVYASAEGGFESVWYRDGDIVGMEFGRSDCFGIADLNSDGVQELLVTSGPAAELGNAMLFHSGGPPIVDDDPGGSGGSEETGGDPDAGDATAGDAGDATAGDADGTGGSADGDGDGDGCACDARSPHNPAAPRSLAAMLLLAGLGLRRRSSRRRRSSGAVSRMPPRLRASARRPKPATPGSAQSVAQQPCLPNPQ